MEKTAGPAAGLRGRSAESHICQNRADMGHPAVVAGTERKKRHRQVASVEMTKGRTVFPGTVVTEQKPFFHHLGWAAGP